MLAGLTTTAQVAGKPPETRFARPLRAGTTEKPPSPFRVFEKNSTTARTKIVQKLPLVYRYEKWDEASHQYRLQFKENLVFSTTDVFKIYATEPDDTTEIQETIMAADFKNEDILDLLIPASPNTPFLRPVRGTFTGNFLESVLKTKKDGEFVVVESLKNRQSLPFGHVYSKGFTMNSCESFQNRFEAETTSTGILDNDLWVVESAVTTRDCQTHDILQQFRDIDKLNLSGNRVEYLSYTRENGNETLEDHQTWEYDDMNRVTVQTSITNNRKYESTYDEYGNDLTGQFNWDGTAWVQTLRTISELTTDDGITIDTHTTQQMINNGWADRWRNIYHYDDQRRAILVRQDLFNQATQTLELDYYFTYARNDDNQLTETTSYFQGKPGVKDVYRYGPDRQIIHIDEYTCADQASCLQGIYEPALSVDLITHDTLDYVVSNIFTQGSWEKYDSMANVYDHDGSLVEMFYQDFRLHGSSTTLIHERHTFRYTREDAVTGAADDAPDEVTLYPNPVDNMLNIKTRLPNYTVDVYDTYGRLSGHFVNAPALDLSRHAPGVYILSIESQDKRYRRKVVKH